MVLIIGIAVKLLKNREGSYEKEKRVCVCRNHHHHCVRGRGLVNFIRDLSECDHGRKKSNLL